MRNLKHIKLFESFSLLEAFASTSLNKVFNYIKTKESKEKFSNYIGAIAGQIDVPSTAITDEYFEYLPYKDAIRKNVSMDLVDCKATSIQAFGDPTKRGGKGVPGDVCTKGKLKKAYGASGRTREYDCPICNGTGKVSPSGQLKYLKFWLNSKGDFIGVTAVDGLYHANKRDVNQFKQIDITEEVKAVLNREGRNDATVKADLEAIESKYGLESGKTRLATEGLTNYRWRDPSGITIGTYWKDRDGKVYIASGNGRLDDKRQRPVGVKWKEFGSYLAQLPYIFNAVTANIDRGIIKILTDIEEKDDVLYNVGVNFRTYPKSGGGSFSLQDSLDKSFLNEAEFAIIFDFKKFEDDMIANNTKKLSTIKDERTERKKGIIGGKLGISDKDIRNANLERYIKAISDVDITTGFDRLVKKLPRFFGGRLSFFYMYSEKNFVSYRNTILNLLQFMRAEDDDEKKEISNKISDRIKETFNNNKIHSERLDRRLASYKDILADRSVTSENDNEKIFYKSQLDILNKIMQLSAKISNKISQQEVECIEDFEIIYTKINGIYNALKSDRTGLFKGAGGLQYIAYLIDYDDVNRTIRSFESYYGRPTPTPTDLGSTNFNRYVEDTLNKLDYMIRLVERI